MDGRVNIEHGAPPNAATALTNHAAALIAELLRSCGRPVSCHERAATFAPRPKLGHAIDGHAVGQSRFLRSRAVACRLLTLER